MAIRERALQYFSGLDKPISALLKKTPLPNHLRDVLELIADLFFYGHSVIYIKVWNWIHCSLMWNTIKYIVLCGML